MTKPKTEQKKDQWKMKIGNNIHIWSENRQDKSL